jgi:entericidin B
MTTFRKAVIAVLLGLIFASSGCNTVHGVGEDVESGGEAIQGAAEDAKN